MPISQVKLYLDTDLHTRLKVCAAENRVSLSALAAFLIKHGLEGDLTQAEIPNPRKKEAIAP